MCARRLWYLPANTDCLQSSRCVRFTMHPTPAQNKTLRLWKPLRNYSLSHIIWYASSRSQAVNLHQQESRGEVECALIVPSVERVMIWLSALFARQENFVLSHYPLVASTYL